MKTKIVKIGLLIGAVILLGGCGNSSSKKQTETINPFNPGSMIKTYDRSKVKINSAVEKENNHLNKILKESELK